MKNGWLEDYVLSFWGPVYFEFRGEVCETSRGDSLHQTLIFLSLILCYGVFPMGDPWVNFQ